MSFVPQSSGNGFFLCLGGHLGLQTMNCPEQIWEELLDSALGITDWQNILGEKCIGKKI